MLNDRTYGNILARLEDYEDVESLSARQLANITYTSPSTISRFVKKSGFRNFSEMKLKLIQEKEANASNSLDEWGAMLNVAFSSISLSDLNIISENKEKKILVYSERKYLLVARQLVELLLLEGIYSVMVNDLYLASLNKDDNHCLISIGTVSKKIYYRNIKYYEIKFKSDDEELDAPNIRRINFTTPRLLNFDTTSPIFQIACFNIFICMLIETLNID